MFIHISYYFIFFYKQKQCKNIGFSAFSSPYTFNLKSFNPKEHKHSKCSLRYIDKHCPLQGKFGSKAQKYTVLSSFCLLRTVCLMEEYYFILQVKLHPSPCHFFKYLQTVLSKIQRVIF